eukprot:3025334-Rhodomonas_salina.1
MTISSSFTNLQNAGTELGLIQWRATRDSFRKNSLPSSLRTGNYQGVEGILERLKELEVSLRKPGPGDAYTTQDEQDTFNQAKDAEEVSLLAQAQSLGWPKYQTLQKEREVALKAESAKDL